MPHEEGCGAVDRWTVPKAKNAVSHAFFSGERTIRPSRCSEESNTDTRETLRPPNAIVRRVSLNPVPSRATNGKQTRAASGG